jgi:hypothetical protein
MIRFIIRLYPVIQPRLPAAGTVRQAGARKNEIDKN